MIIRKLFKFEGSHRVLDCTADRCKKSFHGHSYVVEVFLSSDGPDNAGMVCDFHLLKNVKMFIDSFDHTHVISSQESEDVKSFFKENNERWIEMSINPSAENFAAMFYYFIEGILKATDFLNGENGIRLESVRVHETATGYAEAFCSDMYHWLPKAISLSFSSGVRKDWNANLTHFIDEIGTVHPDKIYFINPKIK